MSTTYYVANAGSNSNAGTSSGLPFQTFAHAVSVAIAADTILLNGPDTFTENVTIAVSLASLSSYGTGKATVISASSTTMTVAFTAVPVSVTNINFQGTTSVFSGTTYDIVRITTTGTGVVAGCTVTGCTFSNGENAGLRLYHSSTDNGGITGVRINNNTFNNIGGIGLYIHALLANAVNFNYSDMIVTANTISNILGNTGSSGTAYGWGIAIGNANTSAGPSLVHDNVIHDLGANATETLVSGGFGIQCEGCNGLQAYNNICYNLFNTTASGSDGGQAYDIDVENQNCVFFNNYAYNCDGPLLGCYSLGSLTGNVFHHNVGVNMARNTPYGGIYFDATAPYVLYNNTIICGGSKPCVSTINSITPTSTLLNNTFVAPAGVATVVIGTAAVITSMTMDGNYHQSGDSLFSCTNAAGTNYTSLSTWHANTGFETSGAAAGHCYFVAPQPPPTTLAGAKAFAPISGSPLINAGANLSGTYSITPAADFLGNPWTQNSIGAIYVAGTPTAYMTAVYADSPMAVFRLADAAGTASSDSVGTFEPLALSAVTLGSTSIVAGDGSPTSAGFNGTSSSASGVATLHTYALAAFTYETWFNAASVAIANGTIMESFSVGSGHLGFVLFLSDTTLSFYVRDATTGLVQGSLAGVVLAVNTPYHFLVAYAGGTTLAVYINGVSQTITYVSQVALSSLPLGQMFIGYDSASRRWVDGTISDAALYASALSGTRALAHYTAGISVIRGRRTLYDRAGCRGVA